MNIIKNADIARKYQVSRASATRWVKQAKSKKNDLILEEFKGKFYVIDNEHNRGILKKLSVESKKYLNESNTKKVKYNHNLNKYFSEDEVLDLYYGIKERRDINLKYTYRDEGAKDWDRLYQDKISYISDVVENLLQNSFSYLSYYVNQSEINIVDIGPGNGYPLKSTISHFSYEKKVGRYITIDISQEMQDIATKNIVGWFPDIETKSYIGNFEFMQFNSIFRGSKLQAEVNSNVIFFIGNTLCNFDDRVSVLKNLSDGMDEKDLLVTTLSLKNIKTRSAINYQKSSHQVHKHSWIPELIGIDVQDCEVEIFFDEKENRKIRYLVLDKFYELEFEFFGKKKTVLLKKGDKISTWKHYLIDKTQILEEFSQAGLEVSFISFDNDNSTALVMAKVKKVIEEI